MARVGLRAHAREHLWRVEEDEECVTRCARPNGRDAVGDRTEVHDRVARRALGGVWRGVVVARGRRRRAGRAGVAVVVQPAARAADEEAQLAAVASAVAAAERDVDLLGVSRAEDVIQKEGSLEWNVASRWAWPLRANPPPPRSRRGRTVAACVSVWNRKHGRCAASAR